MSVEQRLSSIKTKDKESINNNNLQIIIMTLLSILKKNEVKMRKKSTNILKKEKVSLFLYKGN